MAAIVRTIEIEAPIETAFETICDFSSYTKFLDGMRASKIVEETESRALVQFTLDLFKRINYTLELKKKHPTQLSWKLVEADLMKRNDGGWKLKKLDNNRTEAEYTIDIEFKIWVPGPISNFLVNTSIPSTLASFKKEIEKRAGGGKKKGK